MFFEVVSDISQSVENYLSRFNIREDEPLLKSTLVLPEIIREYEDLVLGSQVSIKLSFYFKRHNIEVGPEEISEEIFKTLESDATREYFIGRNVYVNAKISPSESMKYLIHHGSNHLSPFLSKSPFVKEVLERVIGSIDVSGKFCPNYLDVFKENSFAQLSNVLGIRDQKLVYLTSISDPEFEEAHLIKNYPSRDNPIWMFSEFDRIVSLYFNQRSEGSSPEYLGSKIKSSLHTVPASHEALKRAHHELEYFSCLYDYFLLDALRRSKPELLWAHIISIQRTTMALWNDPWIRLSIEGRSVKGDGGELDHIFRMLSILRSAIVSLLG